MSILASSIACCAGRTVAAGVAASKVAAIAGTAVTPGVGTAVGLAGGFVGGTVGTLVTKTTGDILYEDDAEKYGRLFNAYVPCLISEYLLDEQEISDLITSFENIEVKEFKSLFVKLTKADKQESVIRDFLDQYFETIIYKRNKFFLPQPENILKAIVELTENIVVA